MGSVATLGVGCGNNASCQIEDDFNRANAANLGADWVNNDVGLPINITSNVAALPYDNAYDGVTVYASEFHRTPLNYAQQEVKITFASSLTGNANTTRWMRLYVRVDDAVARQNHYAAEFRNRIVGPAYSGRNIWKVVAGVVTSIAQDAGDVAVGEWHFKADGTTITFWREGGGAALQAVDGAIATGDYGGWGMWYNCAGNGSGWLTGDDYEAVTF